jgi:hypothetical protein
VSAFWEGLLNAVHTPSEQAERDKAGVLGRLRAEVKSLPESVTEGLKTANLVSVDNIIDAIRSLSRGSTPGEDDMGLEFCLDNIHEIALLLNSLYADVLAKGPQPPSHPPPHPSLPLSPSVAVPPSAAVWSMPRCRVLWFFSINYLRKKKTTFAKSK